MDFDLSLNQEVQLKITPELKLGLELLSMNYLEVNKKINELALENVFLEFTTKEALYPQLTDFSINRLDDRNPILSLVNEESLYEKIKKDLKLELDPASYLAASYIISKIDDRGILTVSKSYIGEKLGWKQGDLEELLSKIRSMEPQGLAFETIEDFLKSQTEDEKLRLLIDNYLVDVGENKIPHIARKMKLSYEEVNRLLEELKKLRPYPLFGLDLFERKTDYICPDVLVKNKDDTLVFEVLAHEKDVVISSNYMKMLEEAEGDSRAYLLKKFRQADFIRKSLEERRINTEKVMTFILSRQEDFFLHQGQLKTLTRSELAHELDLSPSTVTRIVNNKYLTCDRGIYPLAYFFIEAVGKNSGDLSRDYIGTRILKLVEEEDPKKPLSDQAIKLRLNEEEIEIERRTVAKYRKNLGIKSSRARRIYD